MELDQTASLARNADRGDLADRLDPLDFRAVSRFGQEVSERLVALTADQLKLINDGVDREPEIILEAMVHELSLLRLDDSGSGGFLASLPLIGELIAGDGRRERRLAETDERLDGLSARLRAQEARLEAELARLEGLETETARVLEDTEVCIRVGDARLAELRSDTGVGGATAADIETAQELLDQRRILDHLERRLSQLRVTRLSALQNVEQIRLAREARRTFLQGIQELLQTSLPLWKRQFLVARARAEEVRMRKAKHGLDIAKGRVPLGRPGRGQTQGRHPRDDRGEPTENDAMKELTHRTLSAVQDRLERFRMLAGVDRGCD